MPLGAVIARDMVTNLLQDSPAASPTCSRRPITRRPRRVAGALNTRFGGGTAHALDAETVRVNMPADVRERPVVVSSPTPATLKSTPDQLAKVVINERTGTIVMGGDVGLAPVAIAHGNLSITISTNNQAVPAGPFTNAPR